MRDVRSKITTLFTGSLVVMGLAGCGSNINDQMAGHWTSPCASSAGGTNFAKRDVVNTSTTYQDKIDVYSDSACSSAFFSLRISGPYTVGEQSTAVPGAYNASFVFEHVYITPKSDAAAGYLNSAPCGAGSWKVNVEQDVYATGCQPLYFPVFATACKQEYDLAKVDGTSYLNGTRPSNGGFLCTESGRPTTLGDPAIRAN